MYSLARHSAPRAQVRCRASPKDHLPAFVRQLVERRRAVEAARRKDLDAMLALGRSLVTKEVEFVKFAFSKKPAEPSASATVDFEDHESDSEDDAPPPSK